MPPNRRNDGGSGGGRGGGGGSSDGNRRRGGKGGKGGGGGGTAAGAVADAIARKEAAERKLSKDGPVGAAAACDALLSVAAALRATLASATALGSGPDADAAFAVHATTRHDATLALGEALSGAAAAGLLAARLAPLSPELTAAESAAIARAVDLYRDAATVLAQLVGSAPGGCPQPYTLNPRTSTQEP